MKLDDVTRDQLAGWEGALLAGVVEVGVVYIAELVRCLELATALFGSYNRFLHAGF